MFCPDHTGSPRGKVRRVENIGGRGGERALPPRPLRPWQGCQPQGVGLEPVLRASPRPPPPPSTPFWLWRDTGSTGPLLWERGRGPKDKVLVYLSGSPAVPVDRPLPLVSQLVVLAASKAKVGASTAAERPE